jgi:hypothetical protein
MLPGPSLPTPAAIMALIGASAFHLCNYLVNHLARIKRCGLLYPLAIVFLAGTLAPVLAVRWLTRNGWIRDDLPVNGGDAALLGISLVVGFCLIALALRGQLRAELRHGLRLFVTLFAVSLAEFLVFLSIVFNCTEAVAGSLLRSPWAAVAAAIVSSALFGLYHFTHFPPWNNWAQAARLFVVWLFVCIAYVLTRDAWAATIIDTSFATIGFVRNRVTTLDHIPTVTALALDALGIVSVVAIIR